MMRLKNKLLMNLRREASEIKEDLRRDWGDDFYECIKDIAEHPVVLRMKLYPHHGHTNCYQHCLHVAYYNYVLCRFFQLDARSAARGGMLHDLFLYDWHTHAARTGDHFHGMTPVSYTHLDVYKRQLLSLFNLISVFTHDKAISGMAYGYTIPTVSVFRYYNFSFY